MAKEAFCVSFAIFSEKTTPVSFRKTHFLQFYAFLRRNLNQEILNMDYDGIIELEGMEFHAFHGCLEKERREGNTFLVDFHAEMELKKAVKTDDLRETADYGRIYDIVAEYKEISKETMAASFKANLASGLPAGTLRTCFVGIHARGGMRSANLGKKPGSKQKTGPETSHLSTSQYFPKLSLSLHD